MKVNRNMPVNPVGYWTSEQFSAAAMEARSATLSDWLRNYGRQNVTKARAVSRELADIKAVSESNS